HGYIVSNHPCCKESSENLTLAMVIDAYEIYGHDPTDKLDHLAHYQIEMLKIKRAADQVLLIALEDTVDNMLTMYDNHNALQTERIATYNSAAGGAVPTEFYISQEYYCGKNVYIFLSELYSDIYSMGRGPSPYCKGRAFHFLGFVHFLEDNHYYLEEDPNVAFQMDNYIHGMECNLGSLPNGHTYYTKESFSPLSCDHHVCEWNNTNFYGDTLDGCWFMFPPNYGSIAGISYLDPLTVNEYRFTCQGTGNKVPSSRTTAPSPASATWTRSPSTSTGSRAIAPAI
ncbi:Uncharacterized protein OBRU01_10621, partial [Operophtera brumata]